jgi:hypothetical protein
VGMLLARCNSPLRAAIRRVGQSAPRSGAPRPGDLPGRGPAAEHLGVGPSGRGDAVRRMHNPGQQLALAMELAGAAHGRRGAGHAAVIPTAT